MARDLKKYVGKSVRLVEWPIASKQVTTVKAELMEFWAFEDESAIFHAAFFPRVYEKYCRLLVGARRFIISGTAQEEDGAVTVNVMNMITLQKM